jgi:cyclin C
MAGNFWQSSHYQEWILDRQDILLARKDDLKLFAFEDEYHKLMIFFCSIIQSLGENLKVRQQVIATATVYFRRFYARNPLKSIDPFLLIPACVYLAAKVEEFGMQSQSKLINGISAILKNKYNYAFCTEYPYQIRNVTEAEFCLLEMMDCSLIVYHPYRPLMQLFQQDLPTDDSLVSLAWGIVNDSLRSDVCLMYAPYQIALSCLHLASIVQNKEKDLNNWFADLSCDMGKITEIDRQILRLYELWNSFDEKKEVPVLLQKVPKACPLTVAHQSRPSSNSGNGLNVKPPQEVPAQPSATTVGNLSSHNMPPQQQQHQQQQQQGLL